MAVAALGLTGDWRIAVMESLVAQREVTTANDGLLDQAGLSFLQTGKFVPPTPESYPDDSLLPAT